jgi:hypothetical protein
VTVKPWKQRGRRLRAAVLTSGPKPRICRFVEYDEANRRYAVYAAKGGRSVKELAWAYGSQDQALLAGCAPMRFIDKPHLWRQRIKPLDASRAAGV